jgi:hypothetical protein
MVPKHNARASDGAPDDVPMLCHLCMPSRVHEIIEDIDQAILKLTLNELTILTLVILTRK